MDFTKKNTTPQEAKAASEKAKADSEAAHKAPAKPASNPTPAQVEAAKKADAKAASANADKPAKQAHPFAVMSDDLFLLVDTNNDGIPDRVVVSRPDPKEKAAAAEVAKWAPYYRYIDNARQKAEAKNAGRTALDITAAANVAEADAKARWKGAVPPPPPADTEKAKQEAEAAKQKAAEAAEKARLSQKA